MTQPTTIKTAINAQDAKWMIIFRSWLEIAKVLIPKGLYVPTLLRPLYDLIRYEGYEQYNPSSQISDTPNSSIAESSNTPIEFKHSDETLFNTPVRHIPDINEDNLVSEATGFISLPEQAIHFLNTLMRKLATKSTHRASLFPLNDLLQLTYDQLLGVSTTLSITDKVRIGEILQDILDNQLIQNLNINESQDAEIKAILSSRQIELDLTTQKKKDLIQTICIQYEAYPAIRNYLIAVLLNMNTELILFDGLDQPYSRSHNIIASTLANALRTNQTLTHLSITYSFFSDGVISLLEALHTNVTVTSLELSDNSMGNPGAKHMGHILVVNPNLTHLDISAIQIDEEGVKAMASGLSQHPSLTVFDISRNYIGAAGARVLADCLRQQPLLTELNLYSTGLDEVAAKMIAGMLRSKPKLTHLNVSDNAIGNIGLGAIVEALAENDSLTDVDFSYTGLDEKGAVHIAALLTAKRPLAKLDVSNNPIGDKGIQVIAEAFGAHSTLTELQLAATSIGAEGSRHIAKALQQHTTLLKLRLGGNQLGDEGALVISQALTAHPHLTLLGLSYSQLSDSGIQAIVSELIKMPKLTDLDLTCNEKGDEDKAEDAIVTLLNHHKTLTSLSFYFSDRKYISGVGARKIAEAVKNNDVLTTLDLDLPGTPNSPIYQEIQSYLERNRHNKKQRLSRLFGSLFYQLKTTMDEPQRADISASDEAIVSSIVSSSALTSSSG